MAVVGEGDENYSGARSCYACTSQIRNHQRDCHKFQDPVLLCLSSSVILKSTNLGVITDLRESLDHLS